MSQAAEELSLQMTLGRWCHFTVRKLLSKYSVLCGLRAVSRVVRRSGAGDCPRVSRDGLPADTNVNSDSGANTSSHS